MQHVQSELGVKIVESFAAVKTAGNATRRTVVVDVVVAGPDQIALSRAIQLTMDPTAVEPVCVKVAPSATASKEHAHVPMESPVMHAQIRVQRGSMDQDAKNGSQQTTFSCLIAEYHSFILYRLSTSFVCIL